MTASRDIGRLRLKNKNFCAIIYVVVFSSNTETSDLFQKEAVRGRKPTQSKNSRREVTAYELRLDHKRRENRSLALFLLFSDARS